MKEEELSNPEETELSVVNRTAFTVAAHRGRTDIAYAREIAEAAGAREIHQSYTSEAVDPVERAKTQERMQIAFEARMKGIDLMLKNCGYTDVGEVACGISPRGLGWTKDPAHKYLGTDLGVMIEKDKQVMSKVMTDRGESRDNLHYDEADVLDGQALKAAIGREFADSPVAIVSEGLFIYFDEEKRKLAEANILGILKERGGCWITTDLMSMPIFRSDTGQRSTTFAERTGANMTPCFKTLEELTEHYKELGFVVEVMPQSDVFDDLSSLEGVDPGDKEKYRDRLSESYVFKIEQMK